MSDVEEPIDRKKLREGFTTGACTAAAAKAATRCLVQNITLTEIETTLPVGRKVTFAIKRCESQGSKVVCSIVKDAGDDPDCTHGAELTAEVELKMEPGVEIRGGSGVATVTKPGLGLEVGGPAVNPVPRKNITEMVEEELKGSSFKGAIVTVSVPRGEEMAKETLNARLGLLGGISILGTTGIVKPYSTAAYRASVWQAIDVAKTAGCIEMVFTTGGKSEKYAMELHKHLPEVAFIQVGDFIGAGLKHAAKREIKRVLIVGMMGKLSKMANGKMQTHAAGSEVNLGLLADLAGEIGASQELLGKIRQANTARHVLDLCKEAGFPGLPSKVCEKVVWHCRKHIEGKVEIVAYLVDFDGKLLGKYPND